MKHKTLGQVFTPDWIVKLILDEINFTNENVNKKIVDPAGGDGVFIKEIIKRVIEFNKNKLSKYEILKIINNNIFLFEIDEVAFQKAKNDTIQLIQTLLELENENDIKLNFYLMDTLDKYQEYTNYFDYVIGNPPYIRIHNLNEETRLKLKKLNFTKKGNIDIYIAFFEIGLNLLKENGKLGYISPNSYFKNNSYKDFRKYLVDNHLIETIINFKSEKIFDEFATYTAITILDKNKQKEFFHYKEKINNEIKNINEIYFHKIQDNFNFSNKKDEEFLEKLNMYEKKIKDYFEVQYGLATLRDKIFISDINDINEEFVLFNNFEIEKNIVKKIVKGSKFNGDNYQYILFPYYLDKEENIKSYTEDDMAKKFPKAYNYLLMHKEELLKRDMEKGKNWYEFGRSQGLKSSFKEKVVVSTLLKDSLKTYLLDNNTLVYSGLFITKKENHINWDILINSLENEDFINYIKIKGKDFSSGYKGITSKLIKNFPILRQQNEIT